MGFHSPLDSHWLIAVQATPQNLGRRSVVKRSLTRIGVHMPQQTSRSEHGSTANLLRPSVRVEGYPLVNERNIAGWKITIFNRKYVDSFRLHFPASYVSLPEGNHP